MAHVAQWKKQEVARLAKILVDQPVVGVARIGGIPGPQMQEMRASLREHVQMVGTKNRLLRLAIEEAAKQRPGLEGLSGQVDGQIAVLATDMNPFRLFKQLKAGATMAPLKGGQVAPMDVTVKKGPTPFGPGPIVGEFQKVGIPAKIEGAKVVVTKDVTPVKKGDVVSAGLANMLAKLDIKPVELKVDLRAAFEQDTIFTPDVLDIDDEKVLGQLILAVRQAHEVSLAAAWPTKQNIQELVRRAYKTSHTLALEQDWISRQTIEPLIGKAHKVACAVAIESGFDLGEQQDAVAAAYAAILAGTGKTEADLSDEVKQRLSNHLGILRGAAAAPAASASTEAPAEEEEEEEVSEEDAAAGLGALFG